jgi:tripartite-type tricarboxylate transporter receptor subunit TctC
MLGRRDLIALSAAQVVTTSLLLGAGRAQTPNGTYPSKPVRVIVPVAAGGPTDIVARALADKLSAMWHQQVIIENKSGAGNNLGSEYVARSDPDGYTMLFDPGSMSANTSLYGKLSYDAVKDFAPVSLVALVDYFMFVPNSSPAHSLEEFIDYVKLHPGKLTMASPGTGSAPYLAEMMFLQMAGLSMTHVPYRGAAPAFTDLIPGRVDCYFGSGTLLSYSRSGQVRVLAVTGVKRNPAAPDVPTIAEAGVPGYEVTGMQALFFPAKTARDCEQSQRRHQYGAGRSDAQVQAPGDRLCRRRLHARGAGSAAQGRHRPLERRHQVARPQARLMGRRRSLTAPEALQLE